MIIRNYIRRYHYIPTDVQNDEMCLHTLHCHVENRDATVEHRNKYYEENIYLHLECCKNDEEIKDKSVGH